MANPEGKLTPVQFEIMEMVWDSCVDGVTVTDLWNAISAKRLVTRTTVLNLVDRLEKRGWLKRWKKLGTFHYLATQEREATESLVASEFVAEFFGGSASSLVKNLLGSNQLKADELARLRNMLGDVSAQKERKGDRP